MYLGGRDWEFIVMVCAVFICAAVGFFALIAGAWWLLSNITIVWG